jgi:hypothetical protein
MGALSLTGGGAEAHVPAFGAHEGSGVAPGPGASIWQVSSVSHSFPFGQAVAQYVKLPEICTQLAAAGHVAAVVHGSQMSPRSSSVGPSTAAPSTVLPPRFTSFPQAANAESTIAAAPIEAAATAITRAVDVTGSMRRG